MSELKVEVTKVQEVIDHFNADKLSLVKVYDWTVVSAKNEDRSHHYEPFKSNVIYIPVDSVMDEKLIKFFFGPEPKIKPDSPTSHRVRSIKIRKALSQGIILDLNKDLIDEYPALATVKEGDDVAKILNITKYEPPEVLIPRSMQGQAVSMNLKHPDFKEYTDINNIKFYRDIFAGDDVAVTLKIHGCVDYRTKITMADGSKRTICDLVRNKDQGPVLAMNNQGEIVPSKITDWFNNGRSENWYKIKFSRKRLYRAKGNFYGAIECTGNHKFWNNTLKRWTNAENLKVEDKVLILNPSVSFPYWHQQIIVGKLLGDGTLGRGGRHLEFGHEESKEEYIKFTLSCLGNLAKERIGSYVSGYGSSMLRAGLKESAVMEAFTERWRTSEGKQVPKGLELSPISLAFWYMDDGSLSHHDSQEDRANFATCNFSEESIDNLLESLDHLGIEGHKQSGKSPSSDKTMWRIRLNKDAAEKLFTLITPYIPVCMQYKLPVEFRTGKNPESFTLNLPEVINLSEQKIISVEKTTGRCEYDIETEHHNYVANGIITHNTSARYALLSPHAGSFKSVFKHEYALVDALMGTLLTFNPYDGINTNAIKHNVKVLGRKVKYLLKKGTQFCVGSRRVQLDGKDDDSNQFYSKGPVRYKDTLKSWLKGEFKVIRQRNEAPGNVYKKIAKQYSIESKLKLGEEVFGEIYGEGVQGNYTYGVDKGQKIAVYDVSVDGKFLDHSDLKRWCLERDLPMVPTLYEGSFSPEKLEELRNGNDHEMDKKVPCREGVVVRPLKETNDPRCGRKVLKAISDQYWMGKNTEFH